MFILKLKEIRLSLTFFTAGIRYLKESRLGNRYPKPCYTNAYSYTFKDQYQSHSYVRTAYSHNPSLHPTPIHKLTLASLTWSFNRPRVESLWRWVVVSRTSVIWCTGWVPDSFRYMTLGIVILDVVTGLVVDMVSK